MVTEQQQHTCAQHSTAQHNTAVSSDVVQLTQGPLEINTEHNVVCCVLQGYNQHTDYYTAHVFNEQSDYVNDTLDGKFTVLTIEEVDTRVGCDIEVVQLKD